MVATALFFPTLPFCEILIVAILGQLGDWLRFVGLQDTHFGEVHLWQGSISASVASADRGWPGLGFGAL